MEFDFRGNASLRLLFEVVGVYCSEKGDDASWSWAVCSYARDPRAHSLEILNFCFHNLHHILRFWGEI